MEHHSQVKDPKYKISVLKIVFTYVADVQEESLLAQSFLLCDWSTSFTIPETEQFFLFRKFSKIFRRNG